MLDLIFVNFFNNINFYNFLNIYQQWHPEKFIINFNITCVEGNFPRNFFSQYNYLYGDFSKTIDKQGLIMVSNSINIPLCLDINNRNLRIEDLNDRYLLMQLLALNQKNNYIHCNNQNICKILQDQNFNYNYINDNNFITLNQLNQPIETENKIYNFSNICTNFNNDTLLKLNKLNHKYIYRIMINDINGIIKNFILLQYQYDFYKEYLQS